MGSHKRDSVYLDALASVVVSAVLGDLLGRRGIKQALESIDSDVWFNEVLPELHGVVRQVLAELLNTHDGGQRIAFKDAEEWIARLRPNDRECDPNRPKE